MNRKQKGGFRKRILAGYLLLSIIMTCLIQVLAVSASAEQEMAVVSNLVDLQTAIEDAADGDMIGLQSWIVIKSDIVIGSPDKRITLKLADEDSFFDIDGDVDVLFKNIVFDGDNYSGNRPFVAIHTNVVFEDVTFKDNITSGNGGAVFIDSGTANFRNCLFIGNQASNGGHVFIDGDATVYFENCTLRDGHADFVGGAIHILSQLASCDITASVVTNNTAEEFGGGIANSGQLDIIETKIFHNAALTGGGADLFNNGVMNLHDDLEALEPLFIPDNLKPLGWISDYNDDDSYLKLELEEIQEELPPTETPDPDDGSEGGDEELDPPVDPDESDSGKNEQKPDENEITDGQDPPQESETENPDSSNEQPDQSQENGNSERQDDKKDDAIPPSNTTTNNHSTVTNNSDNQTKSSVTRDTESRTTDANNATTINNYYPDDHSPQPQQQTSYSAFPSSGDSNPYIQQNALTATHTSPTFGELDLQEHNDVATAPNDTPVAPAISDMPTTETDSPAENNPKSKIAWYQIMAVVIPLGILACVLHKKVAKSKLTLSQR